MNSSQQDSMPPPHPKSKKDNNEEEIDGVLEGVEVEEGQIKMLRDPKTGGEVEEGQIVLLRDPKTGKSVPEESTTVEEKDGSDVEKEDIVDDANDDDEDDEDTTKDEKKDTIDEKDGSDIKMKDIVELVGACASVRPSRRSKINAEHKMAAAVKKEESDDEDEDEDDDKDMMEYDNDAEQKISSKDENEEKENNDAVVKKESEGINGDDDMVEDDDKSTSRNSNNKKRKQTKVKDSIKTEKDEEDWEPVEEKPKKRARVSESVVKDAAEKMFAKLVKNYKDGITETPMDILASSITTKAGKPYRNHRSDAIQDGMKLLKAQGRAEKTKGNLGVARLLQSEIDKIPQEKISTDPQQVVKQRKAQFLVSLENCPKGGSGETITDAATIVWNKLLDGNAYTRKELVADTSYKAANSTGFEGIMKVLTQLKLVEGKGQCSFTDKIFPYGRPNKVTK